MIVVMHWTMISVVVDCRARDLGRITNSLEVYIQCSCKQALNTVLCVVRMQDQGQEHVQEEADHAEVGTETAGTTPGELANAPESVDVSMTQAQNNVAGEVNGQELWPAEDETAQTIDCPIMQVTYMSSLSQCCYLCLLSVKSDACISSSLQLQQQCLDSLQLSDSPWQG